MLRGVFRTSRKRKLLEAARSGDLVAALTALDAGAAIECRDVQARGARGRRFASSRTHEREATRRCIPPGRSDVGRAVPRSGGALAMRWLRA
jgi:hypothetical protein